MPKCAKSALKWLGLCIFSCTGLVKCWRLTRNFQIFREKKQNKKTHAHTHTHFFLLYLFIFLIIYLSLYWSIFLFVLIHIYIYIYREINIYIYIKIQAFIYIYMYKHIMSSSFFSRFWSRGNTYVDARQAFVLFENVSRGEERRELNIRSVWTEGSAKPSLFFFVIFLSLSRKAIDCSLKLLLVSPSLLSSDCSSSQTFKIIKIGLAAPQARGPC